MPDLKHDNISLHYEVSGEGPPLLLLAGMLSDSATWLPILPLLEPHFEIIRPDNRTTGRTTPWNAPTSVAQNSTDALALMNHLGHARFHVAGHSMGGLMGLELFGQADPGAVRSLTILASGPVRIQRGMAMFKAMLDIRRSGHDGDALYLRALYPWLFRSSFFDDPENAEQALEAALAYPFGQTADAMEIQIDALANFRPQARLEDVTCPVQTVFATEDLLIPNDQAEKAFRKIPDVEQHWIEDAGHSIVWDAPAAVAQRILEFTKGR